MAGGLGGTALNGAEPTRGWPSVGRVAGYLSAGALLLGTILYLLDATNALGANDYTPAGRSPVQDEAGYWVAQFAHGHHILWDIIARDTLFPLAFLALTFRSPCARSCLPSARPHSSWSRS